jgi:hypothetical protein
MAMRTKPMGANLFRKLSKFQIIKKAHGDKSEENTYISIQIV